LHPDYIVLLLLNHGLKVDINFDAKGGIVFCAHSSLLFYVIHALSSFFTINLQFFDFI